MTIRACRKTLLVCCTLLPTGLEKSVTATAIVVPFLGGSLTPLRSRQATLARPLNVAEERVADGHADGPQEDRHGDADRQGVPREPLLQGHHGQDPRGVAGAAAGGAVDGVEDVQRVDGAEEADDDEVRNQE